ncbi:apolipoprotein N-acyltransferase [Phytohabitans houttuyneae]|uniref:Apolipoprotein N-acyltransferase n=1 Tax=Phytohabitans houttuyneae TaxID=1076126 RepID=A0A6V8KKL0_9ACTN|nr:apolipoprotein N-acyltransferase [Phytohabitans houttuyneae]GFJ84394.1 apolipoprotein N-acyltransferase [Phytohabitans houttuyneae]
MVEPAETTAAEADSPESQRREAPHPLPLAAGAAMALAAGVALLLSFPTYGVWWLAPVGVALLAAAAHRRRFRAGLGLGALAGLVLFLFLLSWSNLHTGLAPWLLLSGLQAGFIALLGGASAYISPLVDRFRWAWPPATALLWVAQEALRDRAPYGGFPWGRLAFSQDDSPLVRLAAVGGAPLVTFGVALAGGLLVTAAWRPWNLWRVRLARGRLVLSAAALTAAAVAVTAAGLLVPTATPSGPPVTVAVVQGNVPRMGLDFNAQRRAVLENHVTATIALAGRVAAGQQPRPDLVVWPENASDVDPLRDATAAARISDAAAAIGAPILVGGILRGPQQGEVRNVGILWLPGTGPDLDQTYVKRHPVPFAEYMPLRDVARLVSKEVDRVANMVAGDRPGVIRTGPVAVGDVICFEVAYDGIVRDTVTNGAGILAVQTNNATFDVAEARQQMAMVRLRAVEHGRESLMASTVGVSGFVTADGKVHQDTGFNTQEVIVRQLHTSQSRTLATRLGVWPEVLLVGLGLVVLAGAVVVRRRG